MRLVTGVVEQHELTVGGELAEAHRLARRDDLVGEAVDGDERHAQLAVARREIAQALLDVGDLGRVGREVTGSHGEAGGDPRVGGIDGTGRKDVAQHERRQRQAQRHDDGGPQQRAQDGDGQDASRVAAASGAPRRRSRRG